VSTASITTSILDSEYGPEREVEDDDVHSIPESQISTEPSLLATPKASTIVSIFKCFFLNEKTNLSFTGNS